MSGTRLDPIVVDVRRRADERRTKQPLARLLDIVEPDSRRRERFVTALGKRELAILAECKRRSPSAGVLLAETDDPKASASAHKSRPGARWLALAQAYASGGADALSVLTEEDHFAGSLDDLPAVEFTGLPRLRKDFILDEGMLVESCLYGADAILLLPAILDDVTLAHLRSVAREFGLATLVEARDARELERALAVEPELVGINARDLATMTVDLATVERLLPRIPNGPIKVAESGIRSVEDLKRVRGAGADAVLVGEALVRAKDPAATLRAWKEALRG